MSEVENKEHSAEELASVAEEILNKMSKENLSPVDKMMTIALLLNGVACSHTNNSKEHSSNFIRNVITATEGLRGEQMDWIIRDHSSQ